MKKKWQAPVLEVLDISMTLNGPGNARADCYDVSDGLHETHVGQSNNGCKGKGSGIFDS